MKIDFSNVIFIDEYRLLLDGVGFIRCSVVVTKKTAKDGGLVICAGIVDQIITGLFRLQLQNFKVKYLFRHVSFLSVKVSQETR